MNNNIKSWIVFFVSFGVWCWSLFLPGFTDIHGKVYLGWGILISGWLGAIVLNFAWYANVAWVFCLVNILRRNFKKALYGSVIAVALGFVSVGVYFGLPIAPESSENYAYLGVGWVIWMLALVMPGIFSYRELKNPEEQEEITLKSIATIFVLIFSLGIAPAIFIYLYQLIPPYL